MAADGTLPVTGYVGAQVPESIRALSPLAADYVDAFTLTTATRATPEQWARTLFGDVPNAAERVIWQGLLGLRLARGRSPQTVAGWRIADRGAEWVRLEADSAIVTGNLVVRAAEGRLTLGTFVRYDSRGGAFIWRLLSPVHRRLAPGLLRDAETAVREAAVG